MEIIFKLSNLLVLPFWVLLLFLPGWKWTERVMRSPWVVLGPAALYAVLALPHVPEHAPVLMRPELNKVADLLGSHAGATIGWAHFLAFDLFVGRWIYLDGRRRAITAWLTAPALFLTLLYGPVGLLLHLCLRAVFGRTEPAGSPSDAPLTF